MTKHVAQPDQEYVAARTALIPQAEKYADDLAGPCPAKGDKTHEIWAANWNRYFHSEMQRLAAVHGIIAAPIIRRTQSPSA